MRSPLALVSTALALVVGLSLTGCTDDADSPDGTSGLIPDNGTDDGFLETSLPAFTDPQFTAAPNPAAGGDGAPSPATTAAVRTGTTVAGAP